jgi:hypothetical protein
LRAMCLSTAGLCADALVRARIWSSSSDTSMDRCKRILDCPARADGVADAFGIGRQTADIQAQFTGSFVADDALRFKHREAVEPLPLPGLIEAFRLIEHVTAACFQPAMVLVHRLGKRARSVDGGVGAKAAPELFHRLGRFGLVVFDRRHIVRAAAPDGAPRWRFVRPWRPCNRPALG